MMPEENGWGKFSLVMVTLLLLGSIFLAAFATVQPVKAQSPVSDDEVNAIAKKLYCPICENTPLDVCPTQACKDWRELIRQQLSQGWTEKQILDYFVANYGQRVLAQPPTRGFSILVWLLPVVGLLGGGVFLWRLFQNWQKGSRPIPETVVEPVARDGLSPELAERIEQEVRSRF